MALIACGAEILIIALSLVIPISIGFVVFVTQNALEDGIIAGLHVASGTIIPPDGSMRARRYREILSVMIPVCRRPAVGGVAGLTGVREIGRRVIGIRCSIIVGLVARKAGCRSSAIRGRMTGDTCRGDMLTCQRERCCVVVESRGQPGSCRVASGTIVIEIVRHVVRIDHSFEISLMAGIAVGRCANISRGMT